MASSDENVHNVHNADVSPSPSEGETYLRRVPLDPEDPESALEDAQSWCETQQDPSALAWASYGQQLQANASPGAAADAYDIVDG